jgi:hypothetical protein
MVEKMYSNIDQVKEREYSAPIWLMGAFLAPFNIIFIHARG